MSLRQDISLGKLDGFASSSSTNKLVVPQAENVYAKLYYHIFVRSFGVNFGHEESSVSWTVDEPLEIVKTTATLSPFDVTV